MTTEYEPFYLIRSKYTGEFYAYRVSDLIFWTEFPLVARKYENMSTACIAAVEMGISADAVEVVCMNMVECRKHPDERLISPVSPSAT